MSILETVNPQTAGSVLSGINPAEEDKLIFVFLNYLREADFFVDFAYEGEARGVQNHNPVK